MVFAQNCFMREAFRFLSLNLMSIHLAIHYILSFNENMFYTNQYCEKRL